MNRYAVSAGYAALCALSVSAVVANPAPARVVPNLYRTHRGDVIAELRFVPVENTLLFQVRAPGKLPSFAVQAALLRSLLPAALAQSRPDRIYFLPSANASMIALLGAAVAKDPGWNGRNGTPRSPRKRLNVYLVDRMNASAVAKPFADAFMAAGYRLSASTASGVMIGARADLNGAHVPVAVSELGFDAVRIDRH